MSGLKERYASRRGVAQDPVTESPAPADEAPATPAETPAPAAETPAPAAETPAPAAETPAPAAETPTPTAEPEILAEPGFLARSRIRRRVRYLRHLREVQLRDIGGFVLELHRFGRERPDLLKAKVAWAAQTDTELRALEHALDEGHAMRDIREPGIGGACTNCGAVHGSQDRYCSTCGEPLTDASGDEDAPSP